MLQRDEPEDYVVATGKAYSVRQFVEFAFDEIGVGIEWKGSGVDEVGVDAKTGAARVKVDPRYFRPSEVEYLLGDPSKAKRDLGWEARIGLRELCGKMVRYDLAYDSFGGEEE
jgi:GDPmannose 4,6-dehydratase